MCLEEFYKLGPAGAVPAPGPQTRFTKLWSCQALSTSVPTAIKPGAMQPDHLSHPHITWSSSDYPCQRLPYCPGKLYRQGHLQDTSTFNWPWGQPLRFWAGSRVGGGNWDRENEWSKAKKREAYLKACIPLPVLSWEYGNERNFYSTCLLEILTPCPVNWALSLCEI